VDHDVDRPQCVHLVGDAASLLELSEVPDDDVGASSQQILHCLEAMLGPHVDDDPMPFADERLRRRSAEPVGRTGHEDAAHGVTWHLLFDSNPPTRAAGACVTLAPCSRTNSHTQPTRNIVLKGSEVFAGGSCGCNARWHRCLVNLLLRG
jgi:hypothetical protein